MTFTEDEVEAVALLGQASIRANMRWGHSAIGRWIQQMIGLELRRLAELYGQPKMEAIARELDARAPSGDLSRPASQRG